MRAIWQTRLAAGALWCALSGVVGCPNTDAAVFVELSIENPNAAVQTSVLATAVDGSFDLRLHLGPRATDGSEVTLGELSITNGDLTSTLVSPLAVTTDPAFPVTVAVDSDVVVAIDFAATDNEVEASAVDALCDPGGIVISGAFDDSLEDALKSVSSRPFQVSGCP
jgi:hypothetical protein